MLALNHSFNVFLTPHDLDRYLESVHAALPDDEGGVVMLDAYGGRSAHLVGRSGRQVDGCPGVSRYYRTVDSWCPVTRICCWSIDFEDAQGGVHTAFRCAPSHSSPPSAWCCAPKRLIHSLGLWVTLSALSRYRWRVWTVDEITAALVRVGFSNVQPLFTSCAGDNSKVSAPPGPEAAHGREGSTDAATAAGAVLGRALGTLSWVVWVGEAALQYDVAEVTGAGQRVVLEPTDPTAEVELPWKDGASREISVRVEATPSTGGSPVAEWHGTLVVEADGSGSGHGARAATTAREAAECEVWAGSVAFDGGNDSVALSDVCVGVSTAKLASAASAADAAEGNRDLDLLEDWYAFIIAVKTPNASKSI